MTDPRELREAARARVVEGSIHTRYHQVNEALVERQERLRYEVVEGALPPKGNRHQRRAAAAKARRRGRRRASSGGSPQRRGICSSRPRRR